MDWRPWMDAFLPPLLEALPGRVAFVGIQGSFGRGEAGPESDVDLVVVLDALGAAELAACRGVLEKMPFADRACGFFCDRAALAAWPAFDALQLRLDTLPVYGSLEELLPPMGKETLDEAVRAAASALYHAACHTALFDAQPEAALPALQKAAFFALRLAHCRRSGLRLLAALDAGALVVLTLANLGQNARLGATALEALECVLQGLAVLHMDFRH